MLIYNTLTREKQELKPIKPNHVGMYVCGITVYDYCHVGHARSFITFDIVTRYLRARGYKVHYVRNITDIDDKIIKRAQENGEDVNTITERFIHAMHEDERALNVLAPDEEPRATAHIPHIIHLIELLMKNGYAYLAESGDVLYQVNRFKTYGELAHQDLAKLRSGARVEVDQHKYDPLDFVLWKRAKPGEPWWESPWGNGRPGWHIECSAMSMQCLSQHFDIHGGGMDLVFPHHQNEIAQSEGATGETFVNIWMHNGFVQINEEKMSKSLGNFFTVRDVLKNYNPEVVRYFIIASHYRSPINYSTDNLDSAKAALDRFYSTLRELPAVQGEMDSQQFEQRFYDAMDDDFNTPIALAVLFDLTREINRLRNGGDIENAAKHARLLKRLADSLGILYQDPETFLQSGISAETLKQIEDLIQAREAARKAKNWAESDRVRDELIKQGVILEDTPKGTVWRLGL